MSKYLFKMFKIFKDFQDYLRSSDKHQFLLYVMLGLNKAINQIR